jgi:hypothetical protein
MATIFLGGIARAIGAIGYPAVEPQIVVAMAIELILPALLVWLQAGVENDLAVA